MPCLDLCRTMEPLSFTVIDHHATTPECAAVMIARCINHAAIFFPWQKTGGQSIDRLPPTFDILIQPPKSRLTITGCERSLS